MNYAKSILIYALIFLTAFQVESQNDSTKEVQNISYYEGKDDLTDYQKQMSNLDINYPTDQYDVPVIVWFHGGGLTAGQKEIPLALTNRGFTVVGVGYRLSPQVNAEVSVEDAAAAIAWVIKNINRYHGDPKKVFVSGHSAGGYLALMSIMNKSFLAEYDLDANDIAGIIPFSGHTITHFTIRKQRNIPGEQPVIDEWAPLFFVRNDAPPILLITGDREKEMLGRYEENAYFYRMMKVAGHDNIDLFEMEGYGHNMAHPAFPLLVKFIKDQTERN